MKFHLEPIVDNDDDEMEDGEDPTPEDIERMEREFREVQSVTRPNSLARWDRVVALFVSKRSPRRKKKSAFQHVFC